VPFTSRSIFCTASRSRRSWKLVPAGKIDGSVHLSMSSDTSAMVCTPSARIWWAIWGTVRVPSTGWPPVIATASL